MFDFTSLFGKGGAGVGDALKATGAQSEASTGFQMPEGVDQALAVTGGQQTQAPAQEAELGGPAKNVLGGLVGGLMGQGGGGGGEVAAEDQGAANQQAAANKLGSAIGAVGRFWTGDYMGAAQNVRNMSGK